MLLCEMYSCKSQLLRSCNYIMNFKHLYYSDYIIYLESHKLLYREYDWHIMMSSYSPKVYFNCYLCNCDSTDWASGINCIILWFILLYKETQLIISHYTIRMAQREKIFQIILKFMRISILSHGLLDHECVNDLFYIDFVIMTRVAYLSSWMIWHGER